MKNVLLGLLAAVVLFGHTSADETAVRQQSVACSATNNPEVASTSFFRKHSRVLNATLVGAGSLLAGWIIVSMMRRQQTGN